MADHSSPQNQNEQLDEAEPIVVEYKVEDEDEDYEEEEEEKEEEDDDEEDEDEDEDEVEESMSFVDELDSEKDEEDEEGEACSSGNKGSERNEWSAARIEGLFCSICMEPWTSGGDHHICCLPCGHIYGMSCIQKWLQQCQNQAKCPQCNGRCKPKDVRKLFASRVVAIDDEAQKRIQSLENKCASLERKRAGWSKKEAKMRVVASLASEFQIFKRWKLYVLPKTCVYFL